MIFLILFISQAFARESWLCTEDSSQAQGTSIYACGVGEAQNESKARQIAFESAKMEFDQICNIESSCGEHDYSAEPRRATCEYQQGQWKCYRLVIYRINQAKRKVVRTPKIQEEEDKKDYGTNPLWETTKAAQASVLATITPLPPVDGQE